MIRYHARVFSLCALPFSDNMTAYIDPLLVPATAELIRAQATIHWLMVHSQVTVLPAGFISEPPLARFAHLQTVLLCFHNLKKFQHGRLQATLWLCIGSGQRWKADLCIHLPSSDDVCGVADLGHKHVWWNSFEQSSPLGIPRN